MNRHIVVIGAGAAGLTAALRAAEAGARVTLLNAHPKIGLKILMSGGTRCNVTHREVSERDYHGGSRPFVARVLRAFTVLQTLEWFDALEVPLKLEETGKYFPASDDAQTVLDAIVGAVERAGVEVRAGARVVRVERVGDLGAEVASGGAGAGAGVATRFRIGIQNVGDSAAFAEVSSVGRAHWDAVAIEPDTWLDADAVIIATGGLSFPRTGSDGTGYSLVESLGHTLEPTVPALTPLAADDLLCRTAQGVTHDVELSLWRGTKRVETVAGSMLLAHFGYTGPAALDLSRHWMRASLETRDDGGSSAPLRVTANFLPGMTREALLERWLYVGTRDSRANVRRFFAASMPDRLALELSREAGVHPTMPLSQVSKADRAALIMRVVERELPVTGTLGYEKAEVTAGGVKLNEVNPSTLESRVAPGVFLCGEVLDVEGRLGGFNFQWAWSSGSVAGKASVQ